MKDQCMSWAKKLVQKEEALRLRELAQEEYILPIRWTLVLVLVPVLALALMPVPVLVPVLALVLY